MYTQGYRPPQQPQQQGNWYAPPPKQSGGKKTPAKKSGSKKKPAKKRVSIKAQLLKVLVVLVLILALAAAVILAGGSDAAFVPSVVLSPLGWGFGAYCLFLMIPIALHIKEAIVWHISISRI